MEIIYFILVLILLCIFMLDANAKAEVKDTRRNIVIIIADDLGWNDVSLHGTEQVLTPNIDTLGYAGVTLGRYYSHAVCTPSRSALLTGKYAYTIGMQGYPLTNSEDRGLPITEKILPQYLKELGYATHLVGKWHVGMSKEQYLPTNRGFDTHFGNRGGYIDYYEYVLEEAWDDGKVSGMDLFRNNTVAFDTEGYITELYTEEAKKIIKSHDESQPLFLMLAHNAPHSANDGALLQAPPKVVRSMRHVESPERRIFAAMMKNLDDSVGEIIENLSEKGILDNTIIVFISDNGAMTSGMFQNPANYGSNYPLRGIKSSPFEGGIRVTGVIWAPEEISHHLFEGYIHVSDWLPTLLKAIGADPPDNIDGYDMWENIMTNNISSRSEFFEIDDVAGHAAITQGDFKLVTGTVPIEVSNYYGTDLLGIIGEPPHYEDAIKNSKVYNVFMSTGKAPYIDESRIRKVLQHQCADFTNSNEVICYPDNGKVCLFNIKNDPCEKKDVSAIHNDLVNRMLRRLEEEKTKVIARSEVYRDPRSHPSLFNYSWHVFAD